ncbi:type II toxin-antitoxin system VapB family antitoxin [Nostoc sp.]
MVTNLEIDENLIKEVLKLGGHLIKHLELLAVRRATQQRTYI